MNIRLILFTGIMTALAGMMIGWAVAHISQRELRTKAIIVTGGVLGFTIGSFQEAIREQKSARDRQDEWEEQ